MAGKRDTALATTQDRFTLQAGSTEGNNPTSSPRIGRRSMSDCAAPIRPAPDLHWNGAMARIGSGERDSLLVARQSERYDQDNDASGSAEAGNGRDSTGPEAAWARESRIRAPREPPPRQQDRWRQNVS